MKITILGSGTSTGVPEYRCECETCTDSMQNGSKNYRTRSSIHIEKDGKHLQFDLGPNFMDQINKNKIDWIDAVIYTHCHSDHISGTNDIVMPCRKQQVDMPIYGPEQTIKILQRNYDYMFIKETFQGGGVGHLIPNVIENKFQLHGFDITPIPVEHSTMDTFGYRIDDFGYLPDVKSLPETSQAMLEGIEVLIIDALSFNPRHPTHQSVGQALEISYALKPKQTYFTHIMHRLDHRYFKDQCAEQDIELPDNAYLAYDGQVIVL